MRPPWRAPGLGFAPLAESSMRAERRARRIHACSLSHSTALGCWSQSGSSFLSCAQFKVRPHEPGFRSWPLVLLSFPRVSSGNPRCPKDLDARFRGHDLRFTVTAFSPHLARGSGHSLVIAPFNCGIRDQCMRNAGYCFLRFPRWPERTWQAKTSQITRVAMRLVISAAS